MIAAKTDRSIITVSGNEIKHFPLFQIARAIEVVAV
jgi:hypothetical protein